MEVFQDLVTLGLSIILSTICIINVVRTFSPMYDLTNEYNKKFEAQLNTMEENKYDKYNNTYVMGYDVVSFIKSTANNNLGIIFQINNGTKDAEGKVIDNQLKYHFNNLIEVPAEQESNIEDYAYLDQAEVPDGTPIDSNEAHCLSDDSLYSCKFISREIKNINGAVVGIYFKQEE